MGASEAGAPPRPPPAPRLALAAALDRRVVRAVAAAYAYVGLWMLVSIAVILFNKWLLAYSGFPFPIALTLWHMLFCSAVGLLAVRGLRAVPSHNMSPREYATRVLPIGLLYAGSLWLSNSAYLHLSVGFIQMTKSLMPGLVYAAGCALGTERLRAGSAGTMAVIAAGVVVCAVGEANLVPLGVAQQLAALAFEALRLTLVQVLMASKGLAMNPMQSLYYVSPACAACLLVPFVTVEWPRIAAAQLAGTLHFNAPVLLANALAALALNLAVFLLIGKTSALTMNIAGVVKDWALILSSHRLFGAPLGGLQVAGYACCCLGVVAYNRAKLRDLQARAAKADGGGASAGAGAGGGKRSDIEDALQQQQQQQPLLTHRRREDLLAEIRRLQAEVALLPGGGGSGSGNAAAGPAGGDKARLLGLAGLDNPPAAGEAGGTIGVGRLEHRGTGVRQQ